MDLKSASQNYNFAAHTTYDDNNIIHYIRFYEATI